MGLPPGANPFGQRSLRSPLRYAAREGRLRYPYACLGGMQTHPADERFAYTQAIDPGNSLIIAHSSR